MRGTLVGGKSFVKHGRGLWEGLVVRAEGVDWVGGEIGFGRVMLYGEEAPEEPPESRDARMQRPPAHAGLAGTAGEPAG